MNGKRHLYEVDLMRAFVMLTVLSVHTLSGYIWMGPASNSGAFVTMSGILTSLHFTRETFMFVTGLVLFVTYYHRELNPLKFWRKRMALVALPYIFWTFAYILFEGTYHASFDWSVRSILHEFVKSLMFGNQFFLYYVLVTIQLYIVFPILIYGLRKLEKWHGYILAGSFVVELAFMYVAKHVLPKINVDALPHILRDMAVYRADFVLTYQFWFIAGGILAAHYDKILDYIVHHRRVLWVVFGIALAAVYGHYAYDSLILHEPYGTATTVLQPIMIPYSLTVTLVVLLIGYGWARRRAQPGWLPFSRFVKIASDTSFGIFLIQPFPLTLVEYTARHMHVPAWLHYSLIPFSILFVYFSSMLIAFWIGKLPGLSYIVGRRGQWRKQTA